MIDTENLLYTDVEREYQRSAVDGLDEDRLALFKLTRVCRSQLARCACSTGTSPTGSSCEGSPSIT
ncbi:hypothetical protein [Streptomyces sp. LUP47B]|uniref:hypothetical protein n=1 Tax=Streptomyces sp. LUP47B TaxID=1890286 RepID=UPI000851E4CE